MAGLLGYLRYSSVLVVPEKVLIEHFRFQDSIENVSICTSNTDTRIRNRLTVTPTIKIRFMVIIFLDLNVAETKNYILFSNIGSFLSPN